MFERRREKILLIATLALLGLLGVDRFVLRPVAGYFARADDEIREMDGKIAEARSILAAGPDAERLETLRAGLLDDDEYGKHIFRQHVRALLAAGVELKSLKPVPAAKILGAEDLRRVGFELVLVGPADPIYRTLDRLDRDENPIRIEKLQIENPSIDEPHLSVRMTVSTAARAKERS